MENKQPKEKKTKAGAKPKGDLLKSELVQSKVTKAERIIIDEKRALTNIGSMSEFVSAVLLNYENKLKKPPKDIVEFKAQVRSLGINMNQIARSLNSKQAAFLNTEEVKARLDTTLKTLNEILFQLKKHYE